MLVYVLKWFGCILEPLSVAFSASCRLLKHLVTLFFLEIPTGMTSSSRPACHCNFPVLYRKKLSATALTLVMTIAFSLPAAGRAVKIVPGTFFQAITYRDVRDFLRDSRRLTQFIRFQAGGIYSGQLVHCSLNFRYNSDFGLSRTEDRLLSGMERQSFDVLLGFVDISSLSGLYSVRLGRQIDWSGPALVAYDGVRAELRLPFHLALSAKTGLKARPKKAAWPDSFSESLARLDAPALFFGTDLELYGFSKIFAGLGWQRTFDGSVVEELVTGHSWFSPFRWMDLSVDADVDALLGDLAGFDAAVVFRPMKILEVKAGYQFSRPFLTGDSIFSVFDIRDRQDISLGLRLDLAPGLSLWLDAKSRSYIREDEQGLVLRVGGKLHIKRFDCRLGIDSEWDYSGNMAIADLVTKMEVVRSLLFIKARLAAILYGGLTTASLSGEKRGVAGFDAASLTTVLGMELSLSGYGKVEIGMESTFDKFYDYLVRAMALLTLEFGG
ncbi:MAG: hypothetical protein GXP49_14490 [Deltaproteobacteria bacterium]|nr:hypothetical protein [Deltaproteobacteria bacterium]